MTGSIVLGSDGTGGVFDWLTWRGREGEGEGGGEGEGERGREGEGEGEGRGNALRIGGLIVYLS